MEPNSPEAHLAAFLEGIGYSTDPECQQTAQRVTTFLSDWSPHRPPPPIEACLWQSESPVLLRDLRFYSLCAHHLLPFFGHADIIHRPAGRIAGFGAFSKVLKHFCQRPQIQERLTEQVSEYLQQSLGGSVLVRLRGRHMCMEMRGTENGGTVETVALCGPDATELRSMLS